MAYKGQNCHYNPFPHLPASSASMGIGKGSHLSGHAHPSGQGLLCPCGLQGPECCPSQSLLGNQPWAPLPGMRVCRCWLGLSAKVWGWENRSGQRSVVSCTYIAVGTGVRGCAAGNAPRGSMHCLESGAPLLRGVRGTGPPLSPHASSCLCRHCQALPPE